MQTAHPDISYRNVDVEFLDMKSVETDPLEFTGTEPGEHRCLECNIGFPTLIKLMAHGSLKHNKKMPMFPCLQCKPSN
jgi:hypothetical protein